MSDEPVHVEVRAVFGADGPCPSVMIGRTHVPAAGNKFVYHAAPTPPKKFDFKGIKRAIDEVMGDSRVVLDMPQESVSVSAVLGPQYDPKFSTRIDFPESP